MDGQRRSDVPNDSPVTPRVSSGALTNLLRCSRRLQATLTEPAPPSRGGGSLRLWNAVTDAIVASHESPSAVLDPTPPADLSVEEQRAFAVALDHYVDDIDDPALTLHHLAGQSAQRPVEAARRFDLTATAPLLFDGAARPVLRRLHLGDSAIAPDAPTQADVATAVALRLRPDANGHLLDVEHLCVSGGGSSMVTVTSADVAELRDTLHTAVEAAVGSVAGSGAAPATAGYWCESCPCLTECDAVASVPATSVAQRFGARSLRGGSRVVTPAPVDPTLGDLRRLASPLVLSPGRIADYQQCPRRYVLRWVLNVPVSNAPDTDSDASIRGRWVHEELRDRHEAFDRHDDAELVNEEMPEDPWIVGRVRNHRNVCPSAEGAAYVGGEVELRWLDRSRAVLVTGRVDALWDRGDTLEIRDYKTGRRNHDLDADPAALMYLLLGAAHATASGHRWANVRVTYEHLDGDVASTQSIESTPERIEAAFEVLDRTSSAILRERRFTATPAPGLCTGCRFRDVCPHSMHETSRP